MCTELLNNAGLPEKKKNNNNKNNKKIKKIKRLNFVKSIQMKLARASGDLTKGVNRYF